MIAYLEGLLAETWGTSCIVVTRGGVGYELDLPAHTMASLPGRGESVALYTSLVVREDDLRRIVLEEDVDALTRVSGIGKKTAQHVFLELKYKLKVEDVPQAAVLAPNGRPGSVFRDVLDGLSNLGYSEDECAPVVKNILLQEPDLDVTGALRAALKALARGRL